MMRVRDLLAMDNISVDVCDDYDERCYIGYDDGFELTDAGRLHFAEALDIPITTITMSGYAGIVGLHCENWREAESCKELFESIAGYCSCGDFDTWFIEK